MKKIAMILSVAAMISFTACGDSADTQSDEQTTEPVLNSGPETEADRAKEAVKDSANAGADSTIRSDADAPSTPH